MTKKEHHIGSNNLFVEEIVPAEIKFTKPLVLVHGSFGGYFMWQMIVTRLTENGFHTLALSLRGHKPSGETDLSKVGMANYVADIEEVINHLNLDEPVIIGHSLAGLLALMYGAQGPVTAIAAIDPSPSLEVQGAGDENQIEKIPLVYTAMDAGMPTDPMAVMEALPDMPQETLMKLKDMLGLESGQARRERKRGISVPKNSLKSPILMIGAERGDSIPFGISLESTRKMAEYYEADFMSVKGATHPGIIMGQHAGQTVDIITAWLKDLKLND